MSGRKIPTIELGLQAGSFGLLVVSGGVRTPVYSHSSYQLGLYRIWNPGKPVFGDMSGGFGLGSMAAIRGLRNSPSEPVGHTYDVTLGPAIWVTWKLLGPLSVSVDALFGMLQNPFLAVKLVFQDSATIALGLKF